MRRGKTSFAQGVPVCDFHGNLLKDFPGTCFNPPERILKRRQIAEPALQELLANVESCRRCIRKGVAGTLHRVLFRISDVVTQANALFSRRPAGFWQPDYLFDLKKKVLVLGDREAAKETFLRPYVDGFDGRFQESLGASISVRRDRFDLPLERAHWRLVNVMWNILGEKAFRQTLRETFFPGASGIIAVCDVSIPSTVYTLESWVDSAYEMVGQVPTVVLATKTRGGKVHRASVEDARAFAAECGASFVGPTSFRKAAVNRMFRVLGTEMVERTFGVRPLNPPAGG